MTAKILGIIAALLVSPAIGAPAMAQTVLKGGHINPKTSGEGIAADRFAELVKAKTGGQITVEMFPSEQLGKATAEIDSTILGNQDIYLGGNVEFERFSPGLKAIGLNYAVPSQAQFHTILRSPMWAEILDQPLDKVGLTVVASDWERGPYRVLVSTRPVKNFDDMKGLKLRIAPIDSWRRSWTALGTQVVVLPWTDVYLGLKQGLVDAVTAPIDLVYPNKFTEVAKYVARTDEYWGVLVLVVNKRKFAGLKPEYQTALREAAQQAGKEYMDTAAKTIEQDIATMKRENGMEYTVLDLKPGIDKMRPVIAELEKEDFIPKGIYERLQVTH